MSESSSQHRPSEEEEELPPVPTSAVPLPILTEDDIAALPPTPPSLSLSDNEDDIYANSNDYVQSDHSYEEGDEEAPLASQSSRDEAEGDAEMDDVVSAPSAEETPQNTSTEDENSSHGVEAEEDTAEAATLPDMPQHSTEGSDDNSHDAGNDEDAGEARAASPVDAPLVVPEFLPAPPSSSSSATPWQSTSSSSSTSASPVAPLPAAFLAHSTTTTAAGTAAGHSEDVRGESQDGADTPTVVDSGSEPRSADEVGNDAAQNDDNTTNNNTAVHHENEEESGAAATTAVNLSADEVEESIRASEEQANAALHRFSTTLHAKLVEQLIDDAAVAVEETLFRTIRQHGSHTRALMAHNSALDAQLTAQAAAMAEMQQTWEATVLRDVQQVLRVDLRAALRAQTSASSGVPPTTGEAGHKPVETRHESHSGDEESSPLQTNAEGNTSISQTGATSTAPEPVSVEELVAAYLGTRSTIEVLQRERKTWRSTIASLQSSLLTATQENVQLRHELAHLRTTTVGLEEHRAALEAREAAAHECTLLQLQLAKQAEEAETLVALLERQALTESTAASAATASGDKGAPVDVAAGATGCEAVLRKGPVWDTAMQELEAQASLAAQSRRLHAELEDATAALKQLEAERDAATTYAAELKKEGDALRADAQSLVYRNGVLSQQVASLLVKVENTTRAYRHLKARAGQADDALQHSPLMDSHRSSVSDVPSTSFDHALMPSKLLTSLPSTASRRSNWFSSMWPSRSTATAAAPVAPPSTLPPFSSPSPAPANTSTASSLGRSLNTAVLYDQPASSSIQQLLYMPGASADVAFLRGPVEVEEGVQQRLDTYRASHVAAPAALTGLAAAATASPHHGHLQRRSRQTSLRQLGSAPLEVSLACAPRLPASDQLSGSALGRPSAYATLDPLHGTVTRRVGRVEVAASTAQKGAGGEGTQATSAPPSSSSSASVVASVEDVNEDPQLLSMLDTLDKDESLDRFSVNSVSELVVRNQELVKQLYDATQRAEVAEKKEQELQQQHQSLLEEASARSSALPVDGEDALPASLTTPAAALLRHAETTARLQSRASDAPNRKRERTEGEGGDNGLVQSVHEAHSTLSNPTPTTAQDTQGGAENKQNVGSVNDENNDGTASSPAAAAVEPWFLESASTAVASMVDALVRRHEVRLTAADTDVSRALLRALAAQRVADAASTPAPDALADSPSAAEETAQAPSRAMAVCLRSLLQLCVRQSATIAEVALHAAGQQQAMQQAVKETWTEVQATLLRALQTSQVALTTSHENSAQSTAAQSRLTSLSTSSASPLLQRTRTEELGSSGTIATATRQTAESAVAGLLRHRADDDAFRVEEQVTLLQELSTLLQTAAKKDGTLLHVYQAAQARQEARQRQQKERLSRLLLKLERKRRLIKALRLRQAHVGSADGAAGQATARGLSHAGQDGEGGTSVVNTQSTVAGSAAFRLSPQPGSPVHRTPPLAPMALPSATTLPGSPQPRLHFAPETSRSGRASSGSSEKRLDDEDTDASEDEDDEAVTLDVFRDLEQQLAFSQATHRAVQTELDEEKRRHTQMLERMWTLETACDEATEAKKLLEKQLEGMVDRADYQAVADELAKATEELKAREAQLSNAATAHHALQEQLAAVTSQREAEQLQAKAQCGQLEETVRRREQRLLVEEDRYRELNAQLSDVKQHAAGLENANALLRREQQEKAQTIRERDATVAELKSETLMREDAQAVLCRLFPGDTALQANAQLVRRLSHTTTRLQVELSEVRQDLAHAQEELRRRELQVREAVQDRQAAEVRLQDALAQLAELQDDDYASLNNTNRANGSAALNEDEEETGATPSGQQQQERLVESGSESPNVAHSPTSTGIDALFNVEGASVTALRHRVRFLTTRLEAYVADLAVLRDASAAAKAREEDLRRQLELMSDDPISRTARKYGLTACATFAAQMEEMQARQTALQAAREAAEAEKTRLTQELAAAVREAAETAQQRDDAAAHARSLEAQLADLQAEARERTASLALLETQQQDAQAKHEQLLQQHQRTLSDLHDLSHKLREAEVLLEACRAQRDQFLEDNNKMISSVEKLEKALLQSEAEKVMAREALSQGLSSSAGSHRRHRGGGGGHRGVGADRYHNQSSLTQDLSLSSLAPSP